jgi:chromosome segregation ATPase
MEIVHIGDKVRSLADLDLAQEIEELRSNNNGQVIGRGSRLRSSSDDEEDELVLNFHNNYLTDLVGLPQCKNLTELNLSSNNFGTVYLSQLATIPTLRSLDLSANRINTLEDLPSLACLKHLYIAHNEIRSCAEIDLRVPNLVELDIRGNLLADYVSILPLTRLKMLAQLQISGKNRSKNMVATRATNLARLFSEIAALETIDEHGKEYWNTLEDQEVAAALQESPDVSYFSTNQADDSYSIDPLVVATPKLDFLSRRYKFLKMATDRSAEKHAETHSSPRAESPLLQSAQELILTQSQQCTELELKVHALNEKLAAAEDLEVQLKKELESFESRLQEEQQKFQALSEEHDIAVEELKNSQQETLCELQNRLHEREADIKNLEEQLKAEEDKSSDSTARTASLASENDILSSELLALKETSRQLELKVEDLEQQLHEEKSGSALLTTKNVTLESENGKLQTELSTLKGAIEVATAGAVENISLLSSRVTKLTEENAVLFEKVKLSDIALERKTEELKNLASDLAGLKDSSQQTPIELARLVAQSEELAAAILAKDAQHLQLLSDLEASRKETSRLQEINQQLEDKMARLVEEFSAKTKHSDDLKTGQSVDTGRNESLEKRLLAVHDAFEQATAKNEVLAGQVSVLERKKRELKDFIRESEVLITKQGEEIKFLTQKHSQDRQEMQSQLRMLNLEVQRLREKPCSACQQKAMELSSLKQHNQQLVQELRDLQESLRSYQSSDGSANTQALVSEIDNLKTVIAGNNKSLTDQMHLILDMRQQLSNGHTELQRKQSELNELHAQVRKQSSDIEELQALLVDKNARDGDLEEEIGSLQEEIKQLKDQSASKDTKGVQSLLDTTTRLQEELASQEKVISVMRKKENELRTELAQTAESLSEEKLKSSHLATENGALVSKFVSLENKNDELVDGISELRV